MHKLLPSGLCTFTRRPLRRLTSKFYRPKNPDKAGLLGTKNIIKESYIDKACAFICALVRKIDTAFHFVLNRLPFTLSGVLFLAARCPTIPPHHTVARPSVAVVLFMTAVSVSASSFTLRYHYTITFPICQVLFEKKLKKFFRRITSKSLQSKSGNFRPRLAERVIFWQGFQKSLRESMPFSFRLSIRRGCSFHHRTVSSGFVLRLPPIFSVRATRF